MNPQIIIEIFLTRNGRTLSSQRVLLLLRFEAPLYKKYCALKPSIYICHCLDANISFYKMDRKFTFGGIICYRDSHLDKILRFSKVFTLHAILHDAAGSVYLHNGKGLGYWYMIG